MYHNPKVNAKFRKPKSTKKVPKTAHLDDHDIYESSDRSQSHKIHDHITKPNKKRESIYRPETERQSVPNRRYEQSEINRRHDHTVESKRENADFDCDYSSPTPNKSSSSQQSSSENKRGGLPKTESNSSSEGDDKALEDYLYTERGYAKNKCLNFLLTADQKIPNEFEVINQSLGKKYHLCRAKNGNPVSISKYKEFTPMPRSYQRFGRYFRSRSVLKKTKNIREKSQKKKTSFDIDDYTDDVFTSLMERKGFNKYVKDAEKEKNIKKIRAIFGIPANYFDWIEKNK